MREGDEHAKAVIIYIFLSLEEYFNAWQAFSDTTWQTPES